MDRTITRAMQSSSVISRTIHNLSKTLREEMNSKHIPHWMVLLKKAFI